MPSRCLNIFLASLILNATAVFADPQTLRNGDDLFLSGVSANETLTAPRDVLAAGATVSLRGTVAADIMLARPASGVSGCKPFLNSARLAAATKLIRCPKVFLASAALIVAVSPFGNGSQTMTLRTPSASRGSPPTPSTLSVLPDAAPSKGTRSAVSISPSASRLPLSCSKKRSSKGRPVAAISSLISAMRFRLNSAGSSNATLSGTLASIHTGQRRRHTATLVGKP